MSKARLSGKEFVVRERLPSVTSQRRKKMPNAGVQRARTNWESRLVVDKKLPDSRSAATTCSACSVRLCRTQGFLVYKVIYFDNTTILNHEVLSSICTYIPGTHVGLNHIDHALDQSFGRNNLFHARWINAIVDWKFGVMFAFNKPLFISDIFLQCVDRNPDVYVFWRNSIHQ